ncbi:hypothetical protein SLEP1_g58057 [Rubroshorea leprosula]|uniref:Uncharacterized protein n=1 Tax=Rubroshorea leprosula TaxID=152421 RepID=A0AAV5MNH3_9ROSI|nr:hypothetical protein SLEP1_g58057 [Rubroshorea leprosula]
MLHFLKCKKQLERECEREKNTYIKRKVPLFFALESYGRNPERLIKCLQVDAVICFIV